MSVQTSSTENEDAIFGRFPEGNDTGYLLRGADQTILPNSHQILAACEYWSRSVSLNALNWAFEQSAVAGSAKAVLIVLAHRFNDRRGDCYPGISRIAHDAGLSRDTVIRAVKTLADAGLLEIEKRAGVGKGRQTNVYRFPQHQSASAKSEAATLHKGGKVANDQGQSRKLPGAKSEAATQTESNSKNELKDRRRASRRAPRNFRIDSDLKAWLREKHFDLQFAQTELEKFLDFEFARPYSDWPATFRNWIRRAVGSRSSNPDEPSKITTDSEATRLGLTRQAAESDRQWESRVRDQSVIHKYGYTGRQAQH